MQNKQNPGSNSGQNSVPRPVLKKKSRRFFLTSFLFAVVIIGATWWILSLVSSRLAWKAVFLDSNQVYFGRFTNIPFTSSIKLHDVHYLKPVTTNTGDSNTANTSGTSSPEPAPAQGDLSVLSVINDVHGPEDVMVINKDHILYYQKLRPNSTLFRGLSEALK